MNVMNSQSNPYYIARRVSQQGARCPVGDQADSEKYATGRKNTYLRKTLKVGTWNVRKMKDRGKKTEHGLQ